MTSPVSLHDSGSLRERLDAALAGQYLLERELGGAGMSRVFVARELALGRRVVIKALPPELGAGLDAERFRREIQLHAALQHPHVVPVLAAGSAGGVPYYTMPFVDGESLRERLARARAAGAPLPIAEAGRILHDVADALAHAHAQGVVHRDVKPDNVLLGGRHALVTDFGVAKAIVACQAGGDPDGADDGTQTTGAGLAIGTPAYMAPEQVAADPAVDHRADLYAFGVLAYEMLAGTPPFAGRPASALLRAHLTELPPPLGERRPGLPAPLAELVMACLAKRPEERPPSAEGVRDALSAIVTLLGATTPTAPLALPRLAAPPLRVVDAPAAPPRPRRWRRGALLAALVALVLAAGAATMAFLRPAAPATDARLVAVAPFRVSGADPALRFLREGMLDLVAATLTGEGGGPRSASPRAVLGAWRHAAGSDTADLPRDRALEVAERVGAGRLLLGEIGATTPGRVALSATLLTVADGRARPPVRVEGAADSLPRLVERLTAALLAAEAGQGDRSTALSTAPLPALRAYLAGQWAYRRARYRASAAEYERALDADSTFALAGLGLAGAASWYGAPAQRDRGLAVAWRARARLSPQDRALLETIAGPRYPLAPTMAELYAAKQRYAQAAPERPEAWFEAGDALFHFGALLGLADAHARAAAAFGRALALDPGYAPALEHQVLIDARAGDTAAVRRHAARYFAVDPDAEGADGVRWRAAVALGDSAALAALERRAEAIHPVSAHLILEVSQLDGVDLDRAERLAAASHRGHAATRTTDERIADVVAVHDLALARGRPRQALAAVDALRAAGTAERQLRHLLVADALFGDGDTTAAAGAVRALAAAAAGPSPTTADDRARQDADRCLVELWRVSRGDGRGVRPVVARLRTPPAMRPGDAASPARFAAGCAVLLEAAAALPPAAGPAAGPAADPAAAPARAAIAARLDSVVRAAPSGGLLGAVGPLVLARVHEVRGDAAAALAVLRRRPYLFARTAFLATMLREEARLAARTGDREGAARAWRHYAALRAGAEPGLGDRPATRPAGEGAGA